jgi:hypothetical protein
MGNGFARARWVGLLGAVLLGLLPAACDQSAPSADAANVDAANADAANADTPNGSDNVPNADAPSSMALDAEPLAPAANDGSVAPPPPPPGSFLAQLSPDQVAQLTSLGIDVVVPGTVTPSFQVADLRITQGDTDLSYLIVYQNAENQCFAVEFADSGTSPPPATESRLPIKPPLFTQENGGPSYSLNYGKYSDPAWQAKFPDSNLYTDWLAGPSGYYRLTGAADIKALFATFDHCKDVDPKTAVDLVESFTLITTAPMGATF